MGKVNKFFKDYHKGMNKPDSKIVVCGGRRAGRKILQEFANNNQEEILEEAKETMIDSLAYEVLSLSKEEKFDKIRNGIIDNLPGIEHWQKKLMKSDFPLKQQNLLLSGNTRPLVNTVGLNLKGVDNTALGAFKRKEGTNGCPEPIEKPLEWDQIPLTIETANTIKEALPSVNEYQKVFINTPSESKKLYSRIDKAVPGSDRKGIIVVCGSGVQVGKTATMQYVMAKQIAEPFIIPPKRETEQRTKRYKESCGLIGIPSGLNPRPDFKRYYQGAIDIQKYEEDKDAFNALLEYELNMMCKYDRPNMHSKTPPKGERMQDFADRYGTCISKMKEKRNEVEDYLERKKGKLK